jgi:hypothetical protein
MVGNYRANMIGDLATLLVDCWDAATATEGQGEMTKQALYTVRGFMQAARKFGPALLNWIQGLFNVWGSKTPGITPDSPASSAAPAAGAPAVARAVSGPTLARLDGDASSAARKAASAVIVAELTQAKTAYVMANGMIDVAAQVVPHIVAHMEEQMRVVLGGQDPFEFFRNAGANILHSLSERAGTLENAAVLSTSGKDKADAVRAGCDRAARSTRCGSRASTSRAPTCCSARCAAPSTARRTWPAHRSTSCAAAPTRSPSSCRSSPTARASRSPGAVSSWRS